MPGTMKMGSSVFVPFQINETDTLAGTTQELVSPVAGVIKRIVVIVAKAVTTGGAVKVINGASTDVVGATVTVADAATKGTIYEGEATPGDASQVIAENGRFQVAPAAAFATAGAVNGFVEISTGN